MDISTYALDGVDLADLQRTDADASELIQAINDPEYGTALLQRRAKNFSIQNEILYKRNPRPDGQMKLIFIPKNLVGEILFSTHNEPLAGHLGLAKTTHKIMSRYFWYIMRKDIEKYVRGCEDCQTRKGTANAKPAGLLHPLSIGLPFDRVGIDLLGPFRRSKKGKKFIIVATDYATRWAETKAIFSGKIEPVASFILENIICRHGAPRVLLSDRGIVFRSQSYKRIIKTDGG